MLETRSVTLFLQDGNGWSMFVPWIVIGAIFVFLVVLPARRERRAKEVMLSNLKKGDRVLTQAGMVGKIARFEDDLVVLDFEGTKIPVLKSTIVRVFDLKSESK